MTASRKSTVQSILSRRDAWIQMVGSFAFAAGLALMAEPSCWGALFFFLCGIPGLVALVWPERSGGDQGDAVDLIVHTAVHKVRIREQDLFGDGFFDLIAAVPGFSREQYAAAAQHSLRGWEHVVGKKFLVMTRASG